MALSMVISAPLSRPISPIGVVLLGGVYGNTAGLSNQLARSSFVKPDALGIRCVKVAVGTALHPRVRVAPARIRACAASALGSCLGPDVEALLRPRVDNLDRRKYALP